MEGSLTTSSPTFVGEAALPSTPVRQTENGSYAGRDNSQTKGTPSYQSLRYEETTPVMQHSQYSRLPSHEQFSSGITEHLPYENLPNATGVYEKMSGVMKTVKEKMATLRPRRKGKN